STDISERSIPISYADMRFFCSSSVSITEIPQFSLHGWLIESISELIPTQCNIFPGREPPKTRAGAQERCNLGEEHGYTTDA
ncbi:MAG: hypothetical protein AAFW66_10090, partial [Pseudomonadota bacterium]